MARAIAAVLGLLISTGAALGAARLAQAGDYYVNLHGGPRYLVDADLSRDPHGEPLRVGRLHFDNLGVVVGASAGYSWDMGLAAEAEFAYRRNGLDEDVFSGVSTDVHGTLSSYTLMANGYYRFHNDTPFTPYIGGGVGISLLDLDERREGESTIHAFDTDTQFAYQGIAGLAYSFAPHWSLGLEYRYFGTQDPSFIDHVSGTRVWTETVYHAHEVLFGVTYVFE